MVLNKSCMHWDDKNKQFVMSKVSKITHNVESRMSANKTSTVKKNLGIGDRVHNVNIAWWDFP